MKKIGVFLLTCVMLLSFVLPSYAVNFSDVPEDGWYKEFVYDLSEKGVINGYPDGTFKPENTVSVAEFLKLIITASVQDVDYELVETNFEHWAAPYVKVAENYGVINKGEYTRAEMDRGISRIEIVKILSNCDMIIRKGLQQTTINVFNDTEELSEMELILLRHAVGIGVINGYPDNTFKPNDSLKRSECAKVIYTYTNR